MKVSELIRELEEFHKRYGDLELTIMEYECDSEYEIKSIKRESYFAEGRGTVQFCELMLIDLEIPEKLTCPKCKNQKWYRYYNGAYDEELTLVCSNCDCEIEVQP